MENNLQATSWDNTNVYLGFDDPQISNDFNLINEKLIYLKSKLTVFEVLTPNIENEKQSKLMETLGLAQELYRINMDLQIYLYTLRMYASTANSVDTTNQQAKELLNKCTQTMADLKKTLKPLQIFLLRAPESYLEAFLQSDKVEEASFLLRHARKETEFLLSVDEEVLLEGHSVSGFDAWGKLYDDISGTMKVNVAGETLGLANAANILFQSDAEKRKLAYRAINTAWEQNEVVAAAILNSITGWRLENNKARSKNRELHYLDKSCHQQSITKDTLTALMQTTYERRDIGHDALKIMAKELKSEKLGPWDLLAAYPEKATEQKISFPEAMELIKYAFGKFHPEMAEFAQMMYEKRWIDSLPTPNRRQGAYCTGFARVREPRVFLTYDGSMKNIMTLAHELGHAYHNWVIKDLKFTKTFYPSTLAETASIFAETLVREAILENAKTNEEKKKILWQEIDSASSLLINIPARFEFEKRLNELRKTKAVTAQDCKNLMRESWQYWYEDTLSEYNEMFWASKLHFSLTGLSFYNYPYLFGYLFSLGIYAKKETYKEQFKDLYIAILKDTGVMTAEELIQKHFNEDISQKNFWSKSLDIVKRSVDEYKKLI